MLSKYRKDMTYSVGNGAEFDSLHAEAQEWLKAGRVVLHETTSSESVVAATLETNP